MGALGNISQWGYMQFLGLGVVLTAVYYFTLFDGGDKIMATTHQVQSTLEAKKTELEHIRKAQTEKEKTEEEMNLIAEQLKSVLQYLPTEFNQADLMREVIEEARVAGTKNIKIQPRGDNEKGDFYEAMFIEISFESTFSQAATFLAALTKIPRIINVDKIDLVTKSDPSEAPILSFQGTLVGYRYIEQAKPTEPAAAAAPSAPAAPPPKGD
jgi:Tfp pilus assembly protein PilO